MIKIHGHMYACACVCKYTSVQGLCMDLCWNEKRNKKKKGAEEDKPISGYNEIGRQLKNCGRWEKKWLSMQKKFINNFDHIYQTKVNKFLSIENKY